MTIVMLPALIFLFILGWGMYWIGNGKRTSIVKNKPTIEEKMQDNVTILPIVYEEKQEISCE